MRALWSWFTIVWIALLMMVEPAKAAGGAREAFDKGEYGAAARILQNAEAGHTHLNFDDYLLLAEANERAEGRYDVTQAALDAAAQQIVSDELAVRRRAEVAAVRGRLLSRMGKSQSAARTILEAMAETKRAGSGGTDAFYTLSEAYGIVLTTMGLGEQAVGALAEVCDARMTSLRDGDPRLLSSLYWLGRAELGAGKVSEAQTTLQEVVRIRTVTLGSSHPDTLQARSLLAMVMAKAGNPAFVQERQAILDLWLKRSDHKDARITSARLDVAEDQATLDGTAALVQLRSAYAIAVAASYPIERLTAEAGLRLAKALNALGQYGEALDILSDARARSSQIRDTPLAYDLDVTRAVLYRELNRPADAEPIYRALIAIYDADPTLSRANRLTLLNNLAEVEAAQRHFADATKAQRNVVAERTRMFGESGLETLSAKSALAAYLANDGPAALAEGISLHRQVLAARRALSPPNELAVAASLHNLGTSLDQADEYREAKEKVLEAVAIRSRILGPDHPDTILSRRELAGIMMSAGDLAGARETYASLIASMERERVKATATEEQRRSYFSQSAQTYKLLAFLEAQAGRNSAFAYADAARSRTLLELTTSSEALRSAGDPVGTEQLGAARRALGRLATADTSKMNDADLMQHAVAIDAAAESVAQAEAALQARHPQLQFSSKFQPIDRSRLRLAMGDGSTLLDYIVLGDRVLLLWISPDGTMGSANSVIPGLAETARSYVAMLSAPALAGTAADPLADRAVFAWKDGSFRLRRIDEAIPDDAELVNDVGPIRDALARGLLSELPPEVQKSTRWIVVPDGPLAAIPFDTFFINGAPIAAHTVVSYAPSLGLLIDLTYRLKAHQSLKRDAVMVIGAPAFDRAPAASPLQAWGALPGSKTEVSDLARRYRLRPGQTVFTGTDATEARLRQLDERGALMRYKLIIFSTHAIVDPASSERNAIILMGDGQHPDSDGFVRAAELMSLRTSADLIVVSACQSGVGDWLDGEGSMGLPFALFASGSAATLLTHWSVGDQSSATFMMRFLDKMDHGASAAIALQQTKADFLAGRAGEKWSAPAYWAAFSLFGAPH